MYLKKKYKIVNYELRKFKILKNINLFFKWTRKINTWNQNKQEKTYKYGWIYSFKP